MDPKPDPGMEWQKTVKFDINKKISFYP
jgi:hypothetical protein